MKIHVSLVGAFVMLALPLLLAQETVFRSETRMVEVYATVFDGSKPVDGLAREQFEILDEGAPQKIEVFESPKEPFHCALLLDNTGSMAEVLPALRNSAREFIEQLREKDQVAVYTFTDHVDELVPMTQDKSTARRALTRMRAEGRTALFDAISSVALRLQKLHGKKAVVVLTDGGDNASVLSRGSAAERARKAGVPVFAVAQGEALKDQVAAKMLRELAQATGGHMYKSERSKDIDKVFMAIAADLQSGYLLAFRPLSQDTSQPWHQLQVSVKSGPKSLRVRARTGYSLIE